METLKKSLIIFMFIFSYCGLYAQDYSKIQAAFSASYTSETSKNYKQAVTDMKTVYDEKSYEINLRLGWVSYEAGQYTESISYYQKAISLMPYAIEAKLGYVYPASALGNWDIVKAQYLEILKIDPQNSVVNYRMGLISYTSGDYDSALKYLEKVVNLYPFDYDSVVLYAWANFKLGKLREAKVLFNKALMIRPDDSSAKEGLGLIK
jgi:tetratricopeptide (TPR) repeat protein